MTTEEVKTWLRSYGYLKNEAEQLEEELAYWRSKAEQMTRELSGIPSGSGGGDKVPTCVEKILELERELNAKLSGMVEQRRAIERAIEALDNDLHKEILMGKYIYGCSLSQLAKKMNYDYVYVRKSHGKALQKLKKATESYTPPVI